MDPGSTLIDAQVGAEGQKSGLLGWMGGTMGRALSCLHSRSCGAHRRMLDGGRMQGLRVIPSSLKTHQTHQYNYRCKLGNLSRTGDGQ